MFKFINTFRKDEDGAVTVDWVVLTAAVVGLAIAAYGTISETRWASSMPPAKKWPRRTPSAADAFRREGPGSPASSEPLPPGFPPEPDQGSPGGTSGSPTPRDHQNGPLR